MYSLCTKEIMSYIKEQIIHSYLITKSQVFVDSRMALQLFDWIIESKRQIESWELFLKKKKEIIRTLKYGNTEEAIRDVGQKDTIFNCQ